MNQIDWPPDGQTRKEWKMAVAETRPAWEQCYADEGVAVDLEQIVGALSEGDLMAAGDDL